MGPTGPAPATQSSQVCLADPVSTACTEDLIPGLTMQKPPPRTVPYQPPSFNLYRPTKCLTKEERLEVQHNYISAVSLPCRQGMLTATSSQSPAQPNGSSSSYDIPTKYSPMDSQFTPQGVIPQTSPTDKQSPVRTRNNSLSQNSIPAPEARVPDTPEEKIPKSLNGEGVKNSRKQATASTTATQDSRLCFRCKQLGHLKKDCPELPYCSKYRTRGHIPAKCPTKQQDNRWQDERCKRADKRHKTQREDWKKSQDRPQFSNRTNKCLNCADDQGTRDCPTRQQPHTPPISNPANGTGIYKSSSQSQNHSPQQHSQQSASTMNMSTPTLMVNNPIQSGPQQGQQQHPPPQMPPLNWPANSLTRPVNREQLFKIQEVLRHPS